MIAFRSWTLRTCMFIFSIEYANTQHSIRMRKIAHNPYWFSPVLLTHQIWMCLVLKLQRSLEYRARLHWLLLMYFYAKEHTTSFTEEFHMCTQAFFKVKLWIAIYLKIILGICWFENCVGWLVCLACDWWSLLSFFSPAYLQLKKHYTTTRNTFMCSFDRKCKLKNSKKHLHINAKDFTECLWFAWHQHWHKSCKALSEVKELN